MGKLLAAVIGFALSSFVVKLTTTIGIGLFTYAGLKSLVNGFLDMIEPMTSGLPEYVLNFLAIAGIPEALSLIASALLTRAAIRSAQTWLGVVTPI